MEFIAIIVSVVSITANYLILQKINNLQIHVIVPEPQPVVVDMIVEPTPEKSPTVKDDSHSAWKNQNNIPIGPSRPVPTSVPRPPGEPLERPAGFYR